MYSNKVYNDIQYDYKFYKSMKNEKYFVVNQMMNFCNNHQD